MKTSFSSKFISLAALIGLVAFAPFSRAAQAEASAQVKTSDNKAKPSHAAKVDLNTATKAQLEALPGVGPATADAIIAARPFARVEDLKSVSGIGDAKFGQLSSRVTVRPGNAASVTANHSTPPADSRSSAKVSRNEGVSSGASARTKIDLNSADKTALESLPGVGAATADAIIAARPFKSVDDLKQVRGIGDVKFQQLRPLVTVHARASAPPSPGSGTAPQTATGNSSTDLNKRELGSGAAAKAASKTGSATETQPNLSESGKININTASKQELESLLGIGPVKAQAIIDNRPYKSAEDVMNVKGIKEGTFDQIKDRITVR